MNNNQQIKKKKLGKNEKTKQGILLEQSALALKLQPSKQLHTLFWPHDPWPLHEFGQALLTN